MNSEACKCFLEPNRDLAVKHIFGMDENYADVALMECPMCGTAWLQYTYEVEGFTGSGRWYLGLLSPAQATQLSAANALELLEGMRWYFFGGSYFGGQTGRSSGKIMVKGL